MSFEEFRRIVSDISHVPVVKIERHSMLRDDLGIDSLQMMNFLIHLTDKLHIGFECFIGSDDLTTVGGLYQICVKEGI